VLQHSVSRLTICTAATAVEAICKFRDTFKTVTLLLLYTCISSSYRTKHYHLVVLFYGTSARFRAMASLLTGFWDSRVLMKSGPKWDFTVHNSFTYTTDIPISSHLLDLSKDSWTLCDTPANSHKISLHEGRQCNPCKQTSPKEPSKEETQIRYRRNRTDGCVYI
jgi:hypothetical protein